MALQPYAPIGAMATGNSAGVPDVYVPIFAADEQEEVAKRISRFGPASIKRVALGLYHTLVVGLKGEQPQLLVWGKNYNNVLGLGVDVRERVFPGVVPFFSKEGVFEVSCGTNNSAVLVKRAQQSGGKVYTFGLGNRGRLGYPKSKSEAAAIRQQSGDDKQEDGPSWFTPKPVRVRFRDKCRIARISCGADHTLALSDGGTLYAWGVGAYGNLGQGDTADSYTPVRVVLGSDKAKKKDNRLFGNAASQPVTVTCCAAGAKHSLACTSDGTLWTWGYGGNGRLGLGHNRGSLSPAVVEYISDRDVVFVSAGDSHSACIDRRGVLYTWGNGGFGRLGHGDEGEIPVPRKVEGFGGLPVLQVACGTFHTLALTHKGTVFAWGAGLPLGLGEGEDGGGGIVTAPRHLNDIEPAVLSVAAGPYHSAAVTVAGDLLVWGVGGSSRLGHGDQQNQPFPKFVADLRNRMYVADLQAMLGIRKLKRDYSDIDFLEETGAAGRNSAAWTLQTIACGDSHTVALTGTGAVWVWGSNEEGQLGLGEGVEEDQYEPVQLECFSTPIRRVACGAKHCLAIAQYGDVFAWGANEEGQLGLGVVRPSFEPAAVTAIRQAIEVYCGEDYSACITRSGGAQGGAAGVEFGIEFGDLWTWGSAESGKLGLGEDIASGAILTPQKVPFSVPVCHCALGTSHGLAISAQGECYAWGAGYYGRLGIGSTANAYAPTKCDFPKGVRLRAVAAGAYHSMAISMDGDLWIWGRKDETCSTKNYTSPRIFMQLESPSGVPKVKSIAVSQNHSLAVTETGEVFAWGNNELYQTGCGKKQAEHFDRPEMVLGLPNACQWVATGPQASFFVLESGEVFAAGATKGGRLGIGWVKRSHQQSPAAVITHWAALGDLAAQAAEANVVEEEDEIVRATRTAGEELASANQELSERTIQAFLSRLTFASFEAATEGASSVSWKDMQELLQQEEFDNRVEQIGQLEDDVIVVLGRELDFVLSLAEKERGLERLEATFQNQTLAVVSKVGFDYPRLEMKRALTAILSKLEEFQMMIWTLQQQPAYLLRLFGAINRPWQLEAVAEIAEKIYYEVEDERVKHLFAALMRGLAKQEAERAGTLFACFDPETSALVRLLRAFCLRDLNLLHISHFLLQTENASSLPSFLGTVEKVTFSLSPEEAMTRKGISPGASMSKATKNELRREFHGGLDTLKAFLVSGLARGLCSVPLPPVVRAVLQYATQNVYDRGFLVDYEWLKYGMDFCYCLPSVKLLLHALVIPVFQAPNAYANRCGCASMAPHVVEKFQTCARFLEFCSRPPGTNEGEETMSSAMLIRAIGMECWAALGDAVRYQAEIRDTLDVDLTLDLFMAPYDMTEHFVTLRAEMLCTATNLCKKFEPQLNMSAHDPIAALVRKIADGRNPPFDEKQLAYCRESQTWHTFRMNHRFLITEKNIVFDPLTHAPVPQLFALRQHAPVKENHRLLSVIIRYTPPEAYDPRFILQECVRKLPPVLTARDWRKLHEELEALAAHFASCDPPDYDRCKLTEQATRVIDDMWQSKVDQISVMHWIAQGILERKIHRSYIRHVLRRQDELSAMKRKYEASLKKRMEDMKVAIDAIETLQYPGPIRTQAKKMRVQLWFDTIRDSMKKGGAKTTGGRDYCPSSTFKYAVLVNRDIITRLSPTVTEDVLVNLYVTFTLQKDNSWHVIFTHRVSKGAEQRVADFVIPKEELMHIRRLPPQATHAFLKSGSDPNGFVEFNVLALLQALDEIGGQEW
ncbi:regulator of chromosome condensation (RCC1) repeat-containing protein [Besnoitia besnoiti]|uniref:Regulator of chromosome condensation (RCC1) repeat-containing protein n=1 Tax=Besnoitia besnoiti TaxID=94643 RepID=A0A2A9MJJ8_BESBE|nr:regulator of chromosome condensation (RCC1) repeat-containing protein [Besnoitia besnoiti]PFH38145.1 regulator of chromosome condensation (RCC1) repeat-containing protein [Besnoitia besnoiti]